MGGFEQVADWGFGWLSEGLCVEVWDLVEEGELGCEEGSRGDGGCSCLG